MYEIKDIYLGYLCVVTNIDERKETHASKILKKGIFYKDCLNKFLDIETGIEYENAFYNNDNIGKLKVDRNTLKPIVGYFIEKGIPYKKEMTKTEIINAFYDKNCLNINNLFYGKLLRVIEDATKGQGYSCETIKNTLFYYKELNNTYVDIEENVEYRAFDKINESIGFSKGDLVVKNEEPLKEVLLKYNLLYKDIMNKSELNNLLKELDKKKKEEQKNKIEYANGVNIEEYLTMKISVCGTTSELTEFLKSINEELKPKVLQKKKIRKW